MAQVVCLVTGDIPDRDMKCGLVGLLDCLLERVCESLFRFLLSIDVEEEKIKDKILSGRSELDSLEKVYLRT